MNILKEGEVVEYHGSLEGYDGRKYKIIRVWNHWNYLIYYDLEEILPIYPDSTYHRQLLSAHHSEVLKSN